MLTPMHFGIACGGTGGHLLPGVAVGRVLRDRGHEVTLWLSGRDVESLALTGWDGAVESVASQGFPSGLSWRHACVTGLLLLAFLRCRGRMARKKPDALLAMGSYASVGPGLAARSLGIPLVLHEANAVPGRAIDFLSRWASAAAVAFPEAARLLRSRRVEITGFPLRDDLGQRETRPFFDEEGFTVLVFGGSQGARTLNRLAAGAIGRLNARGLPLRALHLAGVHDEAWVRERYEKDGVRHRVFAFLAKMGQAYAAARVAVCRAGAATCAELSASGLPALLIPLPHARRGHQEANARALQAGGGADVMLQSEATEERIAEWIDRGARDPLRLDRMRKAMQTMAVLDAKERLANLVESVARGSSAASRPDRG